MYFVLGLATAGLLALMVAPMLWRRAVRLTRRRIEQSVPMSLGEIQADKDQLRAEFAMSTRRLEMSIERLKERAAEQLVEIEDKRRLIRLLTDEQSGKLDAVHELEEREREVRQLLHAREERLALAQSDMAALQTNLAERGRTLEQMERALVAAEAAREQRTVELVAKGTELENLQAGLTAALGKHANLAMESTRLQTELAEARAAEAVALQRAEAADARLQRLEGGLAARLAEIADRDRRIDSLLAERDQAVNARDSLDRRLAEATAAYADAQGRIAELTLQRDRDSRRDAGESTARAIAGIEAERDALAAEVAILVDERDRLSAEHAELRRLSGAEWENERMENALLREKLNDIAAEVVRLTRSYRGDAGAPDMAGAVARAPVPPPAEAPSSGEPHNAEGGGRSLAERIRALQRSASQG